MTSTDAIRIELDPPHGIPDFKIGTPKHKVIRDAERYGRVFTYPGYAIAFHPRFEVVFRFGTDDVLSAIEIWRPRENTANAEDTADVTVAWQGIDVFHTPAADLLDRLAALGHPAVIEEPQHPLIPDIPLALSRDPGPGERAEDGLPRFIQSVLIGPEEYLRTGDRLHSRMNKPPDPEDLWQALAAATPKAQAIHALTCLHRIGPVLVTAGIVPADAPVFGDAALDDIRPDMTVEELLAPVHAWAPRLLEHAADEELGEVPGLPDEDLETHRTELVAMAAEATVRVDHEDLAEWAAVCTALTLDTAMHIDTENNLDLGDSNHYPGPRGGAEIAAQLEILALLRDPNTEAVAKIVERSRENREVRFGMSAQKLFIEELLQRCTTAQQNTVAALAAYRCTFALDLPESEQTYPGISRLIDVCHTLADPQAAEESVITELREFLEEILGPEDWPEEYPDGFAYWPFNVAAIVASALDYSAADTLSETHEYIYQIVQIGLSELESARQFADLRAVLAADPALSPTAVFDLLRPDSEALRTRFKAELEKVLAEDKAH